MIAERLHPQAVAYETQFDRKRGLKAEYISKQIDAYIGERLNVRLSKSRYEIRNGLIYGKDMDEPFIEVMKRGVDYRRKTQGENRVDRKREEAEVEGFLKIQEFMLNPNTPTGTMMLSISPVGNKDSSYQHNFYDIFTLKEEQGKRFVEAGRYSSALTIAEYKDKLSPLNFMGNISEDADFLKNPLKIDDVFFENAEQIHAYLHKDHQVTENEEFERIRNSYERLKQEYIENPDPKILDAIKNKADEKGGFVLNKADIFYDPIIGPSIPLTVSQEIDYYGNRKVRVVATGCGSSGSSSGDSLNELNNSSPFSVSEFGKLEDDKYGSRKFECPECGKVNVRPKDTLLKNCQHCNSSKVGC